MNKLVSDILSFHPEDNESGVWYLGQSGFIIKTPDGKITVIDAYLSYSACKGRLDFDRLIPVPVKPEELVCDYYICTHNHLDHADPETIKNLNNKESITFIGPRNVVKSFLEWGIPEKNIRLLEAGETIQLGEINLTGTFCIPNSDLVLDSIGIIFVFRDKVIYHSGDTTYHPFLVYVKKFNITLAILCINGKFGNMNYHDAFSLSNAISPQIAVPCHFDMFPANQENPELFKQLFIQDGSKTTCIIPKPGQLVTKIK